MSWSTLWMTAHGPTPPLYYSVIKLIMNVSASEWWLRLPSAVFGTLTVLLIYLVVRRLADSRAAFASALLLTLSLANIEYSQEGRAYALMGMCMAVSFLGLTIMNQRWRQGPEGFSFGGFLKSGGVLYGVGVLGALYSHNTAVFYWIAAQFFFVGWWFSTFRFSRALLLSWFAVNACVLVLWIPWLLASLQVMDTGQFNWLGHWSFPAAVKIWGRVIALETGYFPVDIVIVSITVLFVALGLVTLRKNPAMVSILLAMLVFSFPVIWAYGLIERPILMRRTLLWGSLFVFILAGIGISRLPLLMERLVLAAIFAVGAFSFNYYNQSDLAEMHDWRSPAQVFREHSREDDVLLFRTTWPAPAFMHYVNQDQSGRRILGWSCTTRRPQFGDWDPYGHYPQVAYGDYQPDGWPQGNIAAATIWVVENECRDRASVIVSNGWLKKSWVLANTWGFKGVTVYQWVPKAQVQRSVAPTR